MRSKTEFDRGNIDGSTNIPVDEIRSRINEIPTDQQIYIYCEAGLRGYLAQRILVQNGFDKVSNLSGGYRSWLPCSKEKQITGEIKSQPVG